MRVILVLLIMLSFACKAIASDDLIEQLLTPVVQVLHKSAANGGSGLIVSSGKVKEEYRTFILTNFHVIDSSIKVKKGIEYRDLVKIRIFTYEEEGRKVSSCETSAYIAVYNKTLDLALLEVVDRSLYFATVVRFYPKDKKLGLFQKIWNVGYPKLLPVNFTEGRITGLQFTMRVGMFGKYATYLRTTAPIYFGNSGGGTFVEIDGIYYVIGLPTRIMNADTPYVNYSVDIDTIREFFKKEKLDFIEHNTKAIPKFIIPKTIPLNNMRTFIIPFDLGPIR